MGLSYVATAGVLLIASLFGVQSLVSTSFEVQDKMTEAQDASSQLRLQALQADLTITDESYNPGLDILTVTMTNDGDMPLDTTLLDLLLDGVHTDILDIEVEGNPQQYWAPGQEAVLRASTPSPPVDIVVVDQTGNIHAWRP